MITDRLGICGRCGSNACYINQPLATVTLRHCYGCGFQSSSVIKRDTKILEEQMFQFPDLYKELTVEDQDGDVWFPSFVNTDEGMVFASGKNASEWKWKAVPKDEDGKTNLEEAVEFDEFDYMDALEFIGCFKPQNEED